MLPSEVRKDDVRWESRASCNKLVTRQLAGRPQGVVSQGTLANYSAMKQLSRDAHKAVVALAATGWAAEVWAAEAMVAGCKQLPCLAMLLRLWRKPIYRSAECIEIGGIKHDAKLKIASYLAIHVGGGGGGEGAGGGLRARLHR